MWGIPLPGGRASSPAALSQDTHPAAEVRGAPPKEESSFHPLPPQNLQSHESTRGTDTALMHLIL